MPMYLTYAYNKLTFLLPADELLEEVSGDGVRIRRQVGLAINVKEYKAFLL